MAQLVRCPASRHALCVVIEPGGVIEIKCRCRRVVRVEGGRATLVGDQDQSRGQSPSQRPEPFNRSEDSCLSPPSAKFTSTAR